MNVETARAHLTLRPVLGPVLAVTRKELRIFFRYSSWAVALLIWPSLFPLMYIFTSRALAGPSGEGLIAYASYAGTTDYISYILTGSLLWMWLNTMLWGFGTSLRTEQQRGTLESNWLAPTPRWVLLAGSSLADAVRWFIYLAIAGAEFYLLFGYRVHGSVWHLLLVLILSIPSVYGLGFLFAGLVLWAREVNVAVFVVRGAMMVFCGMTFPVAVLPGWMQAVSRWIPLTHSIEACRHIVAGEGLAAVADHTVFLLVSGMLLLAAGYAVFAASQRVIKRQGSLGVY